MHCQIAREGRRLSVLKRSFEVKLGILLRIRYENIAGGFLFTCSFQSPKIPFLAFFLTLEIVETLRTKIFSWYIEIYNESYTEEKLFSCATTYKKFSLGNFKASL